LVLVDGLVLLASLTGRTVVAAVITDARGMAKRGFARLLGRGDAGRTELAERRLEQTGSSMARARSCSGPAALLPSNMNMRRHTF
jgi:hypothetical protein